MILANPPFKGSVEKSTIAKDLSKIIDTTKTELLFIENFGSETPSFYDGFTVKY